MDTFDSMETLRERFYLLMNAPALFNAIATGVELGVFRYLSAEPQSDIASIQCAVSVPCHQLRVLMQALCATGLVTRTDGRYSNSSVAQELLASDAEDSWSHILLGWRDVYYPAFAQMTPALRTGTNLALDAYRGNEPTLYGRLSHHPALEAVFHRAMGAFTLRSVDALVARAEFGSVVHLLDVGGGDGVTSSRLVKRHADLRCTILDIPSVSDIADGKIDDSLRGRIIVRPLDIFVDDFPVGADAVLFSHVLEIFAEDRILMLLRKAYDALPLGGRVFVYGYNVSADETSGIFGARLGLYFNVLASGQGMAYPASDYESWLSQVGFTDVTTVVGLPYEHGLSMGTK